MQAQLSKCSAAYLPHGPEFHAANSRGPQHVPTKSRKCNGLFIFNQFDLISGNFCDDVMANKSVVSLPLAVL